MSSAELLTPEPVGSGSRFHVEMRMMRRAVDMTVEFTQFERPRLLGSTSRSATRGGYGRAMLTSGTLTFEPIPSQSFGGSRPVGICIASPSLPQRAQFTMVIC
jgi:hypothetical protein